MEVLSRPSLPKQSARRVRSYGAAILATLLMLLVSLALGQVLDEGVPLVLFVIAVMVSSWYGGLGPGVLSSVLGVLAGNYFLMGPTRSFTFDSSTDWLRIGSFLVAAAVVSSLTEAMHEARRQAELQAREAERGRKALQEADRRKDEFISMLSHELRNPLAPIYNAAQILAVRSHDPAEVERQSKIIARQTRQLIRLVDDLLDISRISRGKIELRKARVELAQVVSTAVEMSRPLIDERRHALTVALPEEPPRIEADAARLAQILSNLLNNAAKYTETGGRIELIAEMMEDSICLRVRDTGIGIAPEMLPRVFDLFEQADSAADRSEGGLGLGLTLVRRLVEMHGGTVEARSPGLGQGTEVVVVLPAPAGLAADPAVDPVADPVADPMIEKTAGEPVDRPAEGEAGEPLKVLIVDDNQDAADSLALLMRMSGHDTRTAYDGLSALEEARTFEPDVMLLDIGLPELDGYGVARRLRQEPGSDGLLLLAMTGYGQEEDLRRSREAGFDHHLIKPVDLDRLRDLLARSGRS